MKGGVWPSLPANASDKKDSFSTGSSIDRAHQKNPKNYLVHQPPPSATMHLPADAAADWQRGVISHQRQQRGGGGGSGGSGGSGSTAAAARRRRWQRGGGRQRGCWAVAAGSAAAATAIARRRHPAVAAG